MYLLRALFPLYTIVLLCGSGVSRAEMSSPSDNMHAYADLVRAQGQFIVDLSLARLNWARANLIDAQAAFEWQRARELELLVDRLELELRRLRKDEFKARAFIAQIESSARRFSVIHTGVTSQFVFQAFRFMLIQVVPSGVVNTAMLVVTPPFSADNFIPHKKGTTPIAFPGGNVGTLMNFLQKNQYSLEPFREAHAAILACIRVMVDAANERVEEIEVQREKLRLGILNMWEIPPSVSVPGVPQPQPSSFPTPFPAPPPAPNPTPTPFS